MYLVERGTNALNHYRVRVGALQESTVAADDLLPRIASDAAERLIHVHDGRVWQVWVCDCDALSRTA